MELFRALGAIAEPPGVETARLFELLELGRPPTPEEYTELFLFQLYPYAAVYLGAEGMLGGEARDRVAGFWRVIQATPPTDPDHLASLLSLYARLKELEDDAEEEAQRAVFRRARIAFLWEHLLSWLPVYLDKLREVAPAPYRAWADLLEDALISEAEGERFPELLPLHLRATTSLAASPPETRLEIVTGLLAPVRSGVILTRIDLARAAHDLALALRAGERRFTLEALLDQDGMAVIQWLQGETGTWAGRHEQRSSWLPAISQEWLERARATGAMLGALPEGAVAV